MVVGLRATAFRASEQVVVTAARQEQAEARTARSVSVVDADELHVRQPRSTPEALEDLAGVLLQKTNHGAGAPYVRGLIGNQVLLLVDGIRLNNSTYRYGPNQYLASVDPYLLRQVEVVRGPGAVLFGSDAIGGVVNLLTTAPAFSEEGLLVRAQVEAKLVSSGMEQAGRVAAAVGGRRVALRAGVTLQSFGDLVAGGALGTERPSGYDHGALDAAALLRVAARQTVSLNVQFDRQPDVPRWDQVAQRGYEVYQFAPQERVLAYSRWQYIGTGDHLRSMTATASYQRTREGRDIKRVNAATATREVDAVRTTGLSTGATGGLAPHVSWTVGVDWSPRSRRQSSRGHDALHRRGLVTSRVVPGRRDGLVVRRVRACDPRPCPLPAGRRDADDVVPCRRQRSAVRRRRSRRNSDDR